MIQDNTHPVAEGVVMDTFTLRLPRSLRVLGRNPLVRTSDRVEAAMLVLAVMVTILAAPVAAAIGTTVHESMSHRYTEQAQTRHTVTATVINDRATDRPPSPKKMLTVDARWVVGGHEYIGQVEAQPTVNTGDHIDLWVDNDGHQVDKPTPVSNPATDAVLAAVAIWSSVAVAAAALFAVTRLVLGRVRATAWQHDIDNLVGHGGGCTSSQS
jgi:hypothetical protein